MLCTLSPTSGHSSTSHWTHDHRNTVLSPETGACQGTSSLQPARVAWDTQQARDLPVPLWPGPHGRPHAVRFLYSQKACGRDTTMWSGQTGNGAKEASWGPHCKESCPQPWWHSSSWASEKQQNCSTIPKLWSWSLLPSHLFKMIFNFINQYTEV